MMFFRMDFKEYVRKNPVSLKLSICISYIWVYRLTHMCFFRDFDISRRCELSVFRFLEHFLTPKMLAHLYEVSII